MKTTLRAATICVALLAGLWVSMTLIAKAGNSGRSVEVLPAPSCDEARREMGIPDTTEFHCEEPAVPISEPPQSHGPYRLIPAGFTGELDYQYVGPAILPKGVTCPTDCATEALMTSPLFVEAELPSGYSLNGIDTFDGESENIIHLTYKGPGPIIEVFRVRRLDLPVDVRMPGPESLTVVQPTLLGDDPAVFYFPAQGYPQGRGFVQVSFVHDGIETMVRGDGIDLNEAVAIAESIQKRALP